MVMPTLKLKYLTHPHRTMRLAYPHFLTKPTRSRLLAAVLRQFVQPAEPEKWVFIVGCYNSGTTLLERLLATHPAISALDEGVFRTDQLVTPEELGWPRMWCRVIDQVRLLPENQTVDVEALKKDWTLFFDRRKQVFLEKSIVNSARMAWLQENFQNSYFIFIVRNGYAVAEGIRRKASKGKWKIQQNLSPSYPIDLCATQWVVTNRIIKQDSKAIKNFRMIHYEELCKAPYQVTEKLWNFIGLREAPNWSKTKKWQIQEKESAIRNMNEKNFVNLSVEDIKQIENVATEMLKHYGYPLLS